MVRGSYSVSNPRFPNLETRPAPRILGGLLTRSGVQYNVKGCWPVLTHTRAGDSVYEHLAILAVSPRDGVAGHLLGKQRSKHTQAQRFQRRGGGWVKGRLQ